MGNIAAAYYGMPRFASTAAGQPHRLQPPHHRRPQGHWRRDRADRSGGSPRRAEDRQPDLRRPLGHGHGGDEFSKTYFDASNPQKGFAALMVCGEADAACPLVKGAAVRISMPYLDPKIYDDSTDEALKYADGGTTSAGSCSA